MAAPRQGLNPTTNSVGFTAKLVTVRSVSADGSTAIVVDRQNTQTQVPMLVQRSKGPLPAAGDSWLISQDLGMWTFAAFVGASESQFAEGGPSGSKVTVAPAPPADPGEGDVWLNSANGNQVSYWDGDAWVAAQLGAAAIAPKTVTAAQIADATITSQQLAPEAGITSAQVAFAASEIGGSRTFTGTAQPSGMAIGDMWFDSGSGNAVSVWTGQGWAPVLLSGPAIAPGGLTAAQLSPTAGIGASQVAFSASEIGGMTVSISGAEPASPAVDDLWYDSTNGYVLKQWNGSNWALYQYGTNAIAAGAITADLIAANTITAAQIAAGLVLAGVVDGTTIIGAVFEGTDWIGDAAGSFYYVPGTTRLAFSISTVNGTDPHGNLYDAGLWAYNASGGGGAALLTGAAPALFLQPASTSHAGTAPQVQGAASGAGSASESQSATLYSGNEASDTANSAVTVFSAANDGSTVAQGALVVTGSAVLRWYANGITEFQPLTNTAGTAASPTLITTDTWHSLGTCGSTGCTLEQARYRLTPDGECEIDIAFVAGSGGSTAGTYTFSNTLPSSPNYQFSGSYLRVYPFAFNAAITTATQNSIVAVDGDAGAVPGRVRVTIPALASGVNLTATCCVPLN